MADKHITVETGIGNIEKMLGDINLNISQNDMNILYQLFNGQAQNKIELKSDLDISPPPLPDKISKRSNLINKYIEQLNHSTYLHIVGEIGMGKTQLCNLIAEETDKELYWFRLRNFNSQIKGFLGELKNVIKDKGIKNFFKSKLTIKDNTIIILDDLPNLDNSIEKELIELVQICDQHKIKIISSSNYPLPKNIIYQYSNQINSTKVEPFTDEETLELLKAYQAPADMYKYAKVINIFSDNHPWIILPTINFLESKKWDIDFNDFFQNKFVDDEIKNFQHIFQQAIPDRQTRELAYRLNIVGRTVLNEDIKAVSEVQPSIDHPFEKLTLLLNRFIYGESDKEYLLSPILYKLGSKNIDSKVEKSINVILGKKLMNKNTLTPYEVSKAFNHFVNAKEYNFAASFLLQGLISLIHEKDIQNGDLFTLPYIWIGVPIPDEVSIDTQLVLRAVQIIFYEKLNKKANELYEDFFKIESQIDSNSFSLILAYLLLFIHSENRNHFRIKLFDKIEALPVEQKKICDENPEFKNLLDVEVLETYTFAGISKVNSYETLKKWLSSIKPIDVHTLHSLLRKGMGKDALNTLQSYISIFVLKNSNKKIINKIYQLLEDFSNNISQPELQDLYIVIKAVSIECLARLDKYDDAERLLKETLEVVDNNKEYTLVLIDGLCKRYIDKDMYTEALSQYSNVIDIDDSNYKNHLCDAYIYSGIAYSRTGKHLNAKTYFEKAIKIFHSLDGNDDILLSRIYGEYSIVLWYLGLHISYLAVSEKIFFILEKSINQDNNADDAKALFQIYMNNFGYVATSLIKGKPPEKIKSGEEYQFFPNKTFFYYDKNELLESHSNEKLYTIYYQHANLYYFLGKKIIGQKYLKKLSLSLGQNSEEPIYLIIEENASLFQDNYKNYYKVLKKYNVGIYLLPFFIKLNSDLLKGINNLQRDKEDFIDILSDTLESKYYDISIYIFDTLNNKESTVTILENNDWLVQRLLFFSKLFTISNKEALETHNIFLKEFFDSQYSSLFSEILKREILEEYFFTFWIKRLETNPSSFKYTSILKDNISKIHLEKIPAYEKCSMLLKLINRYIKR